MSNQLKLKLKIFGRDFANLSEELKQISGPTIEFLGEVGEAEKAKLYSECSAFLNPQEEDFGITAIEAMASGRPVIAYNKGGATETIIGGQTGEFFEEQSWEELADKILRFREAKYDPQFIRRHCEQFSVANFKQKMADYISHLWK